jgi:hypothetical protein
MRTLLQPGPIHPRRIESFGGNARTLTFPLRNGIATIDLLAVDSAGQVHEGRLERGGNPVCITFDLILTRDDA